MSHWYPHVLQHWKPLWYSRTHSMRVFNKKSSKSWDAISKLPEVDTSWLEATVVCTSWSIIFDKAELVLGVHLGWLLTATFFTSCFLGPPKYFWVVYNGSCLFHLFQKQLVFKHTFIFFINITIFQHSGICVIPSYKNLGLVGSFNHVLII